MCGASAGIGKAMALQYSALGAHVVIASRSKAGLEKVPHTMCVGA